jgi:hypothetical protein
MGIRKVRDVTGVPIEDFKQGDDGSKAVDALYKYGRSFPGGKPTQRDYATQAIRKPQPKSPSWDSEYADYRAPSRVPPMQATAPDESQPQFQVDKTADHIDVPTSDWTRSGTHPHFDSGPSGRLYDKKR